MAYPAPQGLTGVKAPPGTPVGSPYPGLPGFYVNADLTPTPIAPARTIAPDEPGGANRPISQDEAIRLYGTDYGVNVGGLPTTPYDPQHDTRNAPQDVQDVAASLRADSAEARLYLAQNPQLQRQVDQLNQTGEGVPVSNPRAFNPGAGYETTTATGERIKLSAGPSGEVSLQGSEKAIAGSASRLSELGLQTTAPQPKDQLAAERSLANRLRGQGYTPVASTPSGGVLALLPIGYAGVGVVENPIQSFAAYPTSEQYRLERQGFEPVASGLGGGTIYSKMVSAGTPVSGTPAAQPEDAFATTNAALKIAQDFATNLGEASGRLSAFRQGKPYDPDTGVQQFNRAISKYFVGIPTGVSAAPVFFYDLARVTPGTQARKLEQYLAEGQPASVAYARSLIDTKGTQAATVGGFIALNAVLPEIGVAGRTVPTLVPVGLAFAGLNAAQAPANRQFETFAFGAGQVTGFQVTSDILRDFSQKGIKTKTSVDVFETGKRQREILTVDALEREGFATSKSEATNVFGLKTNAAQTTRFKSLSVLGGRTSANIYGESATETITGPTGRPLVATSRLEPYDVPFVTTSFSTPGSESPVFFLEPSVLTSRGGGSYALNAARFPQSAVGLPKFSLNAGVVDFASVFGVRKGGAFAAQFQTPAVPQGIANLPALIKPGQAFATQTASVSPEAAAFLRGTARVRPDLTAPASVSYELPAPYTVRAGGKPFFVLDEIVPSESARLAFSTTSPIPAPRALPVGLPTRTTFQTPLTGQGGASIYEGDFGLTFAQTRPLGPKTAVVVPAYRTSFPAQGSAPTPLVQSVLSPSRVDLTGELTPFVAVEKGVASSGATFNVRTTGRYYATPNLEAPAIGLPGNVVFESLADLAPKRPTRPFDFTQAPTANAQLQALLKTGGVQPAPLPPEIQTVVTSAGATTSALASARAAAQAAGISRAAAGSLYGPTASTIGTPAPTTPVLAYFTNSAQESRVLLQNLEKQNARLATQSRQTQVFLTGEQTGTASEQTRALILPAPPILDDATRFLAQTRVGTQTQTRQITQPVAPEPQPGAFAQVFPLPPIPEPFEPGGGGFDFPTGFQFRMPEAPRVQAKRGYQHSPSLLAIYEDIRVVVPEGTKRVKLPETGGVAPRPIVEFAGAKRRPAPVIKGLLDVGMRKLGPALGDQIKTYVVKLRGRK